MSRGFSCYCCLLEAANPRINLQTVRHLLVCSECRRFVNRHCEIPTKVRDVSSEHAYIWDILSKARKEEE